MKTTPKHKERLQAYQQSSAMSDDTVPPKKVRAASTNAATAPPTHVTATAENTSDSDANSKETTFSEKTPQALLASSDMGDYGDDDVVGDDEQEPSTRSLVHAEDRR